MILPLPAIELPSGNVYSCATEASNSNHLGVALVSPAWPPGKISSGIVTYTDELHQELTRRGTRCTVLSTRFEDDASTDWVTRSRPRWLQLSRWINAVARRSRGLLPNVRPEIVSMKSAVAALYERGIIDVVEMEESYGNPALVSHGLDVPLVVRLHGPWFLTNSRCSGNEDTARKAWN